MSGTPMPNCQKNLFPQLHILRSDLFPSWFKFRDRYCDPKLVAAKNGAPAHIDDTGSSNVAELNQLLEQNVMVRKKSNDPDVLIHTRLPPIEYTTVYFEATQEERIILKDSLQSYDDFVREKLLPKAQGNKRMSDYCKMAMANSENVRIEKIKREEKQNKKRGRDMPFIEPFHRGIPPLGPLRYFGETSLETKASVLERPNKATKLTETDDVTDAINACLSRHKADTETSLKESKDVAMNTETPKPTSNIVSIQSTRSGPVGGTPMSPLLVASRTVANVPDEEMKQSKPKSAITIAAQVKQNFFALVTKAVSFKTKPMMNYIVEKMQKIPAGEKGLFFGYRKFILDMLCKCADMAGVKYIRIDGKVDREKREPIFNKFRTKDRYQVAILSIGACGTGINLTCASHVYICELLYTFEKVKQAIARAYRTGQKRNVYVYICLLLGSIEERMWQINRNKLKLESNTLDNTTEFFQSTRLVIPCEKEDEEEEDAAKEQGKEKTKAKDETRVEKKPKEKPKGKSKGKGKDEKMKKQHGENGKMDKKDKVKSKLSRKHKAKVPSNDVEMHIIED
jgi:SNF2 family DNA or RNA helicase